MEKIGNRFRREVKAFAEEHNIPMLRLKKPDRTRWDDRKLDHVRPHLDPSRARGAFRGGGHRVRTRVRLGLQRQGPLSTRVGPTSSSSASSAGSARTTST